MKWNNLKKYILNEILLCLYVYIFILFLFWPDEMCACVLISILTGWNVYCIAFIFPSIRWPL